MEDMEMAHEIVNMDEWCGHPAVHHYWSAPHDRWFCDAFDDDDSTCRCRGADVMHDPSPSSP